MESDATPGAELTPDTSGKVNAATEATQSPHPTPNKVPHHGRNALIGAVIGVALIALLQWFAPATDHQYANIASSIVILLTTLLVTSQLHCLAKRRGHRLLMPAVVVAFIGTLLTVFQFDGFSGELMPQFKNRFAGQPLELRSVGEDSPASSPADSTADIPIAVASFDSLGFLGNDRTGVIADPLFSVPSDVAQVETLWNQGIGQGWSSFSVSSDLAVTLEQREEMECVTCYRLADGELLWMQSHKARHEHSLGGVGPRSTPTIVGDRVYAQGATGRVWCLDLKSGEIQWTVDLLEVAGWDQVESEIWITWGRAGSPLIVDGLCVVPYGGPAINQETGRSLIALDAETGDARWAAGEDQISFASPGLLTLGGKRQIVSVNEKTITGHNIEDGQVLWDFQWPGQSNGGANCAMVIPAGKDRFLIGKGYGGGSALVEVKQDADGVLVAEALWDSPQILKTKFTHACVDGDVAYAISNGSLEAVSVSEGRRLWAQPRRARLGQGQILLAGETIVAQSELGDVVIIAADPLEYRERLRIPALDSITWNIPTIAGRHLLVRNDRQAICFVLPPK